MIKIRFISVFLILITSVNLFSTNYGKITGKVVDANSGEPLIGANIVVTGQSLGAATDQEGEYVILQVPPGEYQISIEYIGYNPAIYDKVQVRTNRITVINGTLKPTVISGEEVVIIAEPSIVEKDNTATLRTINSRDIQNLPAVTVNDVLRSQPGVVDYDGLHFRGGRSGEVTYFLDGVPLVNPLFSEITTSEVINQNYISEMQIISGTFSAEYGNAMSGIVNITAKEGGKSLQTDLDMKSTSLGLNQPSKDYNRNVIRATLSGPFLFSKTNFFLAGSYDDRDSYLPWGYRTESNLFAKITDRHVNNLKLNLSVNFSKGTRKNYSHSWKYIPDQYWYEPQTHSELVQFGFTHTVKQNLYYTLNLYYNAYHYDSGDYDYWELSPAYRLDANNEFYLFSYVSTYEEDDQKTFGWRGDILWQANSNNELKGGIEYRQHDLKRFYINTPYYDDHILDDYRRYPREFAAYLQDKINFSSIILSAGLRFDLTDPNSGYWPDPYDAYYNRDEKYRQADISYQFSPRLGISYPVSEKTVFHFGYGHYFQRPEYQFIYKSMSDENYKQNIIMNLRTGNGRFGNPNLKPERTITYEFGLSHQIYQDFLLNVSAYSKQVRNFTGARTFYPGDKPEYWETFSLHINEDFGYNNGIEIQLKKSRGKYISGEINYTYAVAEASSSGPLERVGIEEANRQSLKFFPTDWDSRHKLNLLLNARVLNDQGPKIAGVHFLENFKLSLLFQYNSGLPYTKGIRGATEPYEINNGRLPENWTIDLKIDRQIRIKELELIPYLEIYNFTDRRNVEYVDPFTGKPDQIIGRTYEFSANPLNWGPPRLIYLGIDIRY